MKLKRQSQNVNMLFFKPLPNSPLKQIRGWGKGYEEKKGKNRTFETSSTLRYWIKTSINLL
jgi:hypothetical protein